jgi:hypothetical protein
MREIRPEGTPYFYFTATDQLPGTSYRDMQLSNFDPFMRTALPAAKDCRLVLVKSQFLAGRALVYFLHWDDGTDLLAVDRRVERNAFTDDDFRRSVKTEYQVTRCDSCKRRWHTLVIPPGDPYDDAPGLYEEKLRTHHLIERCPACNTYFRQLVVKIFAD